MTDAEIDKVAALAAKKVLTTRLTLKDGSTPQVASILVGIIDRSKSQQDQLDDIELYVDGDPETNP